MSLAGSFIGVQYQVPSPSGSLMVWLMVEPHQLDSTKGHRSVVGPRLSLNSTSYLSRRKNFDHPPRPAANGAFSGTSSSWAPTERLSIRAITELVSSIVQIASDPQNRSRNRVARPLDPGHRSAEVADNAIRRCPRLPFSLPDGPSSPRIRAPRGGKAVSRFKAFSPASPPVTNLNQNASRRDRPRPCHPLILQRSAPGLSRIGFV